MDKLYLPETVSAIHAALQALETDEYQTNRWQDLVTVTTTNNGQFIEYNGYAFPNPDHKKEDNPFDGVTKPGQIKTEILNAIASAFVPLTQQPVVYSYLKTGHQTSNRQPVLRNSNLELLKPTDSAFDPFPMARITNTATKEVRFTDYTLDGAAKNLYFYCVAELSDRMTLSAHSPILGPIQLVNTFPAEAPSIKQVLTQMEDSLLGISAGVQFVLNPYTKTEEMQQSKVRIFRAYDLEDTHSVRTMQLAATVDYASVIVDTFDDVSFPPFGETLYYRLVALRKITNEKNEAEYVPSKPSKVVMANVIDTINPIAPTISIQSYTDGATALQNVVLAWDKATHNGSYYLYKMNDVGNWVKIYAITSNADTLQYPPLAGGIPDFTNFSNTQSLAKTDEDGNKIYHRFKVVVENASGLLSLEENILVVGLNAWEYVGGISSDGTDGMAIGATFIVRPS